MGFSIIFPIFPETLKYFLSQEKDISLELTLNFIRYLSPDSENVPFPVLFGGVVGSIYSILQFIFSPIWGKWSDKIGRKPILLFTSLGNLLGYIVWFFSSSFTLFVLSRTITGIMGGNISVASASMADTTSAADRAKGMGIIGAAIGLGFVMGPPIGGILSALDFGAYFSDLKLTIFPATALVASLIAFVNLMLVLFYYKETLENKNNTHQKREIHPIIGIKNTRVKELPLLSFIFFIYIFSFSGFEFCINFYLNDYLGFNPKQIGFTFLYIGVIIILIQGGVIRRISGKVSEFKISSVGSYFLVIGFIAIAIYPEQYYIFFALTFVSIGSAFINPGLSSLTSLCSPTEEQGRNLGILRSFGSLARALSPITFAFIYFTLEPITTFVVSTFLCVLVTLLLFRLKTLYS
ncbi:MAG: MFS transporter [Leptospiraceae bacterium]|nr:MFS transporter [Leptospiraceae bacterium]MCP5493787.1 MFS transporter [Leptospiraceae bacterium]